MYVFYCSNAYRHCDALRQQFIGRKVKRGIPCEAYRKAKQSKEVVFSPMIGRLGVELFWSCVKEVMGDYPKGAIVFGLLNPS